MFLSDDDDDDDAPTLNADLRIIMNVIWRVGHPVPSEKRFQLLFSPAFFHTAIKRLHMEEFQCVVDYIFKPVSV